MTTDLGAGPRATPARQAGQARVVTRGSPLLLDRVKGGANVLSDLGSVNPQNRGGVVEGASTATGQRDGDPMSPRQEIPDSLVLGGSERRGVPASCYDVREHPLTFGHRVDATRQTVYEHEDIDHDLLGCPAVMSESFGDSKSVSTALLVQCGRRPSATLIDVGCVDLVAPPATSRPEHPCASYRAKKPRSGLDRGPTTRGGGPPAYKRSVAKRTLRATYYPSWCVANRAHMRARAQGRRSEGDDDGPIFADGMAEPRLRSDEVDG